MYRILALFLILILLPILLIFGLLIKINYPGSILYSQIREGKNGKPFKIYKLRTMVQNSDELLNRFRNEDVEFSQKWIETGIIKNDPRIAGKTAKIARELSIDEIPQLINVFKGEMAFIGPRPLEIESLEAINSNTRNLRHSVLPGITGLAQVQKRNATIREMQFYDRVFIKNQSIKMKTHILCRTITAIINRSGA